MPERIADLLGERANAPVNDLPADEEILCVNGRWGMPDPDLNLPVGQALVEHDSAHVVAAKLRRADAGYFLENGQLHERVEIRRQVERVLYRYPWDVIGLMNETIAHDILSTRVLDAKVIGDEATVFGAHHVDVDASATVLPGVTFDATQGPIMVDENATVRPGAILCGPCAIGRNATVLDRTLIKANSVIGPGCKVAGEVGDTIFQGFANKAHDGHLGHSWVGKWANFGAGTTNSNLLNTYGEIPMRVDVDGPMHKTGMTFLGAIVGDHVKFAINTRIMTGTVIGTGAMVASTSAPPMCVGRFGWLTDRGEQRFRYERFVSTVEAVMARRNREPSEAYLRLLHELYTG